MQLTKQKIGVKEYISENKDLLLLLYWLFFGIVFWTMELCGGRAYHPVESILDSFIPFCEWFAIPYFFWFIYIIGSMIWFFFKERRVLAKYMWFTIFTYTIVLIIYLIYPTSQNLRPNVSDEGGFLLKTVRWLYGYDTNTNVCPSIHVIGSMAVMFSALSANSIKGKPLKIGYVLAAVLISVSTVFLKQHSIIDVFWGIVVSVAVYPAVFCKNKFSKALLKIVNLN